MTTITLTERASEQIRHLLRDVPAEAGFGLKIGAVSYGWTQRFKLSLGPGPVDGETLVPLAEIDAYVDSGALDLVDGVRIDYVDNRRSPGFTFSSPDRDPSAALRRKAGTVPRQRAGTGATPPGSAGTDIAGSSPAGPAGSGGRLRCPEGVDQGLWDRVHDALDEVRPILQADGGDAAVLDIDAGTVWIELRGACSGCSASQVTVNGLIETKIKALVPEIVGIKVEAANGW